MHKEAKCYSCFVYRSTIFLFWRFDTFGSRSTRTRNGNASTATNNIHNDGSFHIRANTQSRTEIRTVQKSRDSHYTMLALKAL